MTDERLLDILRGARAAIDEALEALEPPAECQHSPESDPDITAMGDKQYSKVCQSCGETYTRPFPAEVTHGNSSRSQADGR